MSDPATTTVAPMPKKKRRLLRWLLPAAAIQIRNPACDGLFCFPVQMPFGKMQRVAEAHHFAQKVRPVAEALQDSRHLLASGFGAPFVIYPGDLTGGFLVFNQLDLGFVAGHDRE